MKVYQVITRTALAAVNCKKMGNFDWLTIHTDRVTELMEKYLPHGSGIDGDHIFDYDKSNKCKLVFHSAFHVMNNNGCYTRWISYTVTVLPSLASGFDLKITGDFGKDQDIKEYLYDLYTQALEEEIE